MVFETFNEGSNDTKSQRSH